MKKNDLYFYYEECKKITMSSFPFFLKKIKQLEKLCDKIHIKDINTQKVSIKRANNNSNQNINIMNKTKIMILSDYFLSKINKLICDKCNIKKLYILGNIIWDNNLKHKIKNHQLYPSDYFIKIILNIYIINNYITNPPIYLTEKQISNFHFIPLHFNKLLIIDALMKQGSFPRYINIDEKSKNEKYIYSEHSGVLSIKNTAIDNIIISTETNRIDMADNNIYLPKNSPIFNKYEYLFHTHPNTSKYGGRINEGIIYEFPSANDLFNFIKYLNEGMAQASLVVAPEGMYVIRQIKLEDKINTDKNIYEPLKNFILKLEKFAMKKKKNILTKITDPDIFHYNISTDIIFIKMYNKFIESMNLFIEFYPRIKKNGEWQLQPINLSYVGKN